MILLSKHSYGVFVKLRILFLLISTWRAEFCSGSIVKPEFSCNQVADLETLIFCLQLTTTL